MRGRFKSWAPSLLEAHPEKSVSGKEDPFFSLSPDLEIGGGKGMFAIRMARKGRKVLSLERDVSSAGAFLKRLLALEEEGESLPVRILRKDFDEAGDILEGHLFPRIYLNFSDPWPKKRHEKRRLTFHPRLLRIASFLAPGGEIRFKSDQLPLYEFTLEECGKAGLKVISAKEDYFLDEEEDAMSEYEENFRKEGKKIHRIIIRRD